MTPTNRSVRLALLTAVGLTLTACNAGPYNRSLNSVHQPVVQRADYVYDVPVDGMGGISTADQSRLKGWLDAIEVGYGDRVSVDDSAAYSGSGREDVAALAARRGLLLADTAPVTEGAIPAGHVRVVVSRTDATVPGCPDWKDTSQADFLGGATHSNYGCATNSMMAAMVADKNDLIRGRSSDSDLRTATSTRAIETYREQEPTGKGGLNTDMSAGQK